MNPFDITKDISYKKQGIIDKYNEGEYRSFLVNRYFSYFADTVFYANEMNRRSHLDNQLQHDYLFNIVRKSSRFSKWGKKENLDILEKLQRHFGYSLSKAKEAMKLLTDEQIQIIVKKETFET